MGCLHNPINHCFQLTSVKAPLHIMTSALRKILMREKEAEYHERPKEESPSRSSLWLDVSGCLSCYLGSQACPHCVTEKHRECKEKKKKHKKKPQPCTVYRYTLPGLIF